MAFNIQSFKTRALTAILFAVIMLCGLLINYWTFFILFSIIHFGCWYEYQKLVALIDKDYADITAFHKYGVMLAGWGFMLFMTNDAFSIGSFSLHEINNSLSESLILHIFLLLCILLSYSIHCIIS